MKGRMRPYLPELTIRDYNTYMRYLRGVRRQMYKSYGFYACHLLRTNKIFYSLQYTIPPPRSSDWNVEQSWK